MTSRVEDRLTWEAEELLAYGLDLEPLNERRAVSLLFRRLLPPHLAARVSITELLPARGRRRYVDAAAVMTPPFGPIEMELRFPVSPLILTHEAAHILLDSSIRRRPVGDHDDAFRATHIWLVRQALGLGTSRLLAAAYDAHGVSYEI